MVDVSELVNEPTFVNVDDFKSSQTGLCSYGFGTCMPLLFCDRLYRTGAMGHFSVNTDVAQGLRGSVNPYPGTGTVSVDPLNDIYPNPPEVKALYLFELGQYAFADPEEVRVTLQRLGFSDFSVVRLGKRGARVPTRDIALNVSDGMIYMYNRRNDAVSSFSIFDV